MIFTPASTPHMRWPAYASHVMALIASVMALMMMPSPAHAAQRNFSAGNFSSIRVVGNLDVTVVQGTRQAIIAEGDSSMLSRISVRTSSRGVLTVMLREASTAFPTEPPVLRITARELSAISYQGNGFLDVERLSGRDTEINLIGAGSAVFRSIDTDSLIVTMASSGLLEMAGVADRHRIAVSGYGQVDAADLMALALDIVAEGTVTVIANAGESVTGLASEGAQLRITGDADCGSMVVSGEEMLDTQVICDSDDPGALPGF